MEVIMSKTPNESLKNPLIKSLRDFFDIEKDAYLDIEVAIKEGGHAVIFHSHPFRDNLLWMEFDLDTNKLYFVLDDGAMRDCGISLDVSVAKHLQNSHQLLMVLLNPETGEAKEGNYIPLTIHRT